MPMTNLKIRLSEILASYDGRIEYGLNRAQQNTALNALLVSICRTHTAQSYKGFSEGFDFEWHQMDSMLAIL